VTGSERHLHVAEQANRILRDERAWAAYAAFVEAQLRRGRMRNLLARVRKLARRLMTVTVTLLSVEIALGAAASPPPSAGLAR
jgi:hypothetical protein